MSERSKREARRLRAKRANPAYLAAERERNGRRMKALHRRRRRAGLCTDCETPSIRARCPKHRAQRKFRLLWNEQRKRRENRA
jgi:hypothetical protein